MSTSVPLLCWATLSITVSVGNLAVEDALLSCWKMPTVGYAIDLGHRICERTDDPQNPYRFSSKEEIAQSTVDRLTKENRNTDADWCRDLACAYLELNAHKKAAEFYERAAKLYRHQFQKQSENGEIARKLADCIKSVDRDEARRLLELAARLSPKNVQVWLDLGELTRFQGITKLLNHHPGSESWSTSVNIDVRTGMARSTFPIDSTNLPDGAKIQQFAADMKKALGYYGQAIHLEPNNSHVYGCVGKYYHSAALILLGLSQQKELSVIYGPNAKLGLTCLHRMMTNWQKAAELDPTCTYLLATGLWMTKVKMVEFIHFHNHVLGPENKVANPDLIKNLKAIDETYSEQMKQVKTYADDSDLRRAVPCLSVLSIEAMTSADFETAIVYATKVLKSDPNNEPIWKQLAIALAYTKNKAGLDTLVRTFPDSANGRLHFYLGSALVKHHDKRTIECWEQGYLKAPEDFLCMIAKAYLLVANPKRTPDDLAKAQTLLQKAKASNGPLREGNEGNLELNLALLDALQRDPLKAHVKLLRISQAHPRLTEAKKAVGILSEVLIVETRMAGEETQDVPPVSPKAFSELPLPKQTSARPSAKMLPVVTEPKLVPAPKRTPMALTPILRTTPNTKVTPVPLRPAPE